mgnify:CR=1 FL=1
MAEGTVRQVIGTVVDVEFPTGELPDVFNAINIDLNGENLYERTLGALAGAMTPGKGPKQAVRNGALQCVLAMVQSLRVTAELVADSITLKLAKSQADVARAQGTVATVFGGRSQPVPLVIARAVLARSERR